MRATTFNHVSVGARSLAESVRFYMDLFGMERIPSPTFRYPTAWLRLGDRQLHLVEREAAAPRFHHFAVTVDDFEAVYLKAIALCEAYQTPVSSHLFVEASGPVLATAPNAVLLEHMDWWQELFEDRLAIVEGAVVLPERPGIGLGLNRAALARFRA